MNAGVLARVPYLYYIATKPSPPATKSECSLGPRASPPATQTMHSTPDARHSLHTTESRSSHMTKRSIRVSLKYYLVLIVTLSVFDRNAIWL